MRWVVFDHGEVISGPAAELPSPAALLGVPVEAFSAAYRAARQACDRSQSDLE